ncbi:hypothetical protein AM1_2585 [Acaryochloris marina MBIC11017]|uniref:Uncharacterized protein n=1 Tax=Acaryochloris marina (strain MBIC 11017) TaxID=329726 RepID=B0C6N7_ACAM1|nr:hypothetical protein AM1_2585 [Acaryochloris marina MBIC11017]
MAKSLVSHGFSIDADYTYARDDSGIAKDFSVDLKASAFLPFSNPNKITAQLELLVECKQRNPNVKWLFCPDPNRADFSPIVLGRTIRTIDRFSQKFFRSNATVEFDENAHHCYKGVEVDESDGRVYDAEIKHGISQLQYALPRLISEAALFNLYGHREDSIPFIVCPILLTTAELLVAHNKLTANMVEDATVLTDIAKSTPYLVLYSDYGPDFERHCTRECSKLGQLDFDEFNDIEKYRAENGEYGFYLPSFLCKSLSEGRRFTLVQYFTQFVICQTSNFDTLMTDIKKATSKAARTLSKQRR